MARGDKGTYNQQEQQSWANSNQAAQQGYANQQQSYGSAYGGYQGELANPGYTAAEQQAMTQATTGSLAGAFDAARQRLQNQAARTGNTAGENATEEQLARQQGQQNAQDMGTLQQQFGQARIQGQQNALQGLGGLYGSSTNATDAAISGGANLVGTQGRIAMQPGFWGSVLAGGLGTAGRLIGGSGRG
ncbi:MAG TPA: hypothetical protein VNF74_03440 [Terriglobales bacterium]|nr:hypothetical protein [Terriglobales bacterium]